MKKWTSIVITCPYEHWCAPLQQYLDFLPTDLLLVVPDPHDSDGGGHGVGSGGATLNALLVAAEHLSAREGHTTIVPSLLKDASIIILHIGPSLLPVPMGLLPISHDSLRSNLEHVVDIASNISRSKKSGIVVAGTDIHLEAQELPNRYCDAKETLLPESDICIVTVPANKSYAARHGVCYSNNNQVSNILYQPDCDTLNHYSPDEDSVNILSGIVWISSDVGESLLSLHSSSPLDSCTYMGIDSGESTLQISFYYDILTSACSEVAYQDFIEGRCGKTLVRGRSASPAMKKARKLVWSAISGYKIVEMSLKGYQHVYLPIIDNFVDSEFIAHVKKMNLLEYNDRVMIGHASQNDSVVILSSSSLDIKTAFKFGTCSSLLTSWDQKLLETSRDPVLITFDCLGGGLCNVVLDSQDSVWRHYKDPGATWLGLPWQQALEALKLEADNVWRDVPEEKRTLYNASVFRLDSRYFSLSQLQEIANIKTYFDMETNMKSSIFCQQIENFGKIVMDRKQTEVFNIAAREGWTHKLLDSWDLRAFELFKEEEISSRTTGELARILAMTADVLGSMARGRGGLRSGPACNRDFASALSLMEHGRYKEAISELCKVRSRWLDQPDRIVRAARHYEGAVQLLIRKTVLSAQKQVEVNFDQRSKQPDMEHLLEVRCPARLDLSGGWTDTPPICYELGGQVVDLAITLNGEKPIGCRAKRVEDLNITVVLSDDYDEQILIEKLSDMDNFCNPNAKGALIKCCLIACKILDPGSMINFKDQLKASLGSGLWLNCWAKLPQGSGLGTSSILASAVVACIWQCCGVKFTNLDVVHSVLVVEQLLSTGGGWQDQVGGVYPALNMGSSPQDTEVKVEVEHLEVSSQFLQLLESRLLVLYTGKPRLAKNLLQNVIRNWYCKDDIITKAFQDNYKVAEECREAVLSEDLEKVGQCMNRYYRIKKILAPGSEPELVKLIFEKLKDDILGGTLCGAGGGGFLVVLLKDGKSMEDAVRRVGQLPGGDKVEHYVAKVDNQGLVVMDN